MIEEIEILKELVETHADEIFNKFDALTTNPEIRNKLLTYLSILIQCRTIPDEEEKPMHHKVMMEDILIAMLSEPQKKVPGKIYLPNQP